MSENSFHIRAFAGSADLQAMTDLLVATRPAHLLGDYPTTSNLQEFLSMPVNQQNTYLWFTKNNQLAGYALLDTTFNNLYFEIIPGTQANEIGSQMIQWGARRLREVKGPADPSLTLDTSCRAEETAHLELLQQHSFVLQEVRTIHMTRPLDQPIPEPKLPPGFYIRPIHGENEAEAVATLHRAAFGTDVMTTEERLNIMRQPDYDREMDLLAVAPDGQLAGYCTCSIYPEENASRGRLDGYTDPVAVHPNFHGKGLARALLLAGMRLLKERGMQYAALGTSSENPAMQRAAEAAGFRVEYSCVWLSKSI